MRNLLLLLLYTCVLNWLQVWFSEMDISVDRRQLLAEGEVPLGLLSCLYRFLVRCNCHRHSPPLDTCCTQSVLGSWSGRLLWMPLPCHDSGPAARLCCTWQAVLRPCGSLFLAVALPLPYYIRLCVYYVYEDSEMEDRRSAVDRLGLKRDWWDIRDLLHWMSPTHAFWLTIYACYTVSLLSLLLIRHSGRGHAVDRIVSETVSDLRRPRASACARLFLAHLLLPVEKLGVVLGLVVGLAVYWPLVLPVCLLVVSCYALPLIYVTGRLLVHRRSECLSTLPTNTDHAHCDHAHSGHAYFASPAHSPHAHCDHGQYDNAKSTSHAECNHHVHSDHAHSVSLSDGGATSFESCCLLAPISGRPDDHATEVHGHVITSTSHMTSADEDGVVGSGCGCVGKTLKLRLIGLLLIMSLWSLSLMYAEAAGFLVEVVVMMPLGFLLNTGSDAARWFVLVVWCVVYVVACYRSALGSYAQFSRAVFAAMKRRATERLLRPAHGDHAYSDHTHCDRNTAFKYFDADELRALRAGEAASANVAEPSHHHDDSIEYQAERLHWNITGLGLFVDRRDRAYIPRALFTRLCRLDVPGGPRSGARVVLRALGRLTAAVLFLLMLGLVVKLSADARQSEESVARTVVVLVCGALPLIVHVVFTRFNATRPGTNQIKS